MTPVPPAGSGPSQGPSTLPLNPSGGDSRSFAESPTQFQTLQDAQQKPAPQGAGTDTNATGPASEWADAVLSSALGGISNDGLSTLR